jgi:hypothetical protein
MKTKHIVLVLTTAVACTLTVAAAAALGDSSPSPAGGEVAASGDAEPTGSPAPAPVQGVSKRLPAIAAAQIADIPGAVPSESVVARQTPVGSVYLTPTARGACMSFVQPDLGAGLTCAADRPATTFVGCSGAPGEPPTCERAFVYGRVPAGVESVQLSSADGTKLESGSGTNGVYLMDVALGARQVADKAAAVEFEHAGEQVREPLAFAGR